MSADTLHLAVTPGDPRGVGPEVMARAAGDFLRESPDTRVTFLGPGNAVGDLPTSSDLVDLGAWNGNEADAGRLSILALERSVAMALEGQADGIVTGPIHKPALVAAGRSLPGQTELLKELTGAGEVGMLMDAERTRLGGPLRVLLATTHVALRSVPERVTEDLLVRQTLLLDDSLRRGWGLEEPRIALCALNPHASDRGMFGDEEARVYAPALETLLRRGLRVEGPIPADTVFSRALGGAFDAVVAPYHDVGMAGFKTAAFGSGVNVTLGLPFVRTSPDHGTAFDIAGTGAADPSSALEAFRLAAGVALRRKSPRVAAGA